MSNAIIKYFGQDTVERAIANYFMEHGVNEEVRDHLMAMEIEDGDDFFQMVETFLEKKG